MQEESVHQWHMVNIQRASAKGIISIDINTALDFLNGFAELCRTAKYRRPEAPPVDLGELQDLVAEMGLSEEDCNWMAFNLLVSPQADHKMYGKKLLVALSHAGSELATIRIMKQVLEEAKDKPSKLNATEVSHMRKHLNQIAARGDNYRAMVLLGKIELKLGNHSVATKLWTDALEPACAHAEEIAAKQARGERLEASGLARSNLEDLDSPWIELHLIHKARGEPVQARRAMEVGCEMDDPFAHYYAALWEKQIDHTTGELSHSSAWLYHMTKAAVSGHPKAAHELGRFYAESLWPYIDDEPPDHIKPTPFDQYPPDGDVTTGESQRQVKEDGESSKETTAGMGLAQVLRERFSRLLSFARKKSETDPRLNIFKTAMFPATAEERMIMAIEWLKIAVAHSYGPSHLLAARLYLTKTLWKDANAPKAALELKPERYTYASRADKEAGKPINEVAGSDTDETVPNPAYNPDQAQYHIREIFHARFAMLVRQHLLHFVAVQRKKSGTRIDEQDAEEAALTEDSLRGQLKWLPSHNGRVPHEVRKYFRFPDVREMYSDDASGVLVDDSGAQPEDIVLAAEAICDEMGWDVFDQNGELMYRHGLRRAEGAGGKAAAGAGR